MSHRNSDIFQALTDKVLILTIAVALATLIIVIPHAHGIGKPEKERSVQIKIYREPPAEIVEVKVKGAPVEPGQKFTGDSDWFSDMTITIKNISDKPIVFATVAVMAPHEKNGARVKVEGGDLHELIELTYGDAPPWPGKPASYRVPPLAPGQTTEVLFDDKSRDLFCSRLRLHDASTDIPELTLSVYQVAFEGDSDKLWMHGFWLRRDSKDPMRWITIDFPPQRNHADRKPRLLGALGSLPKVTFLLCAIR